MRLETFKDFVDGFALRSPRPNTCRTARDFGFPFCSELAIDSLGAMT